MENYDSLKGSEEMLLRECLKYVSVQQRHAYYFGYNALFRGHEEVIYNAIFGCVQKPVPRELNRSNGAVLLNSASASMKVQLGRYDSNAACQDWRAIQMVQSNLEGLPADIRAYDEQQDAEKLTWLCGIRCACKHPELMDPGILLSAKFLK